MTGMDIARRPITHPFNWGKVNQAILDRWSPAALTYIKDKAWKFAEGRS